MIYKAIAFSLTQVKKRGTKRAHKKIQQFHLNHVINRQRQKEASWTAESAGEGTRALDLGLDPNACFWFHYCRSKLSFLVNYVAKRHRAFVIVP